MALKTKRRNYNITGPGRQLAQKRRLATAEWYSTPIQRARMKELMNRRNGPAIRDTLILFSALVILGYIAYLSWGHWWAIPAFLAYGIFYTSPGDSRWHE